MRAIKPAHASWVRSTATRVSEGKLEPSKVHEEGTSYANLSGLGGSDIEALVFLVLMQASKDAQEDLKEIMSNLKSINEKKAKLRQALQALKEGNAIRYNTQLDSLKRAAGLVKQEPKPVRAVALKPVTKVELDNTILDTDKEMDGISEMGDMHSLRLQMYMDRHSKISSVLSNILKKISAASSSIIANLK